MWWLWLGLAFSQPGVREVRHTSCEVIRVNLAVGVTTQVIFEQEPKVTLFADKTHFRVNTNAIVPRSLSIIPVFDDNEVSRLKSRSGVRLSAELDRTYKTNLFVFFENQNQLMLELRFVERERADYILKVHQTFKKECAL